MGNEGVKWEREMNEGYCIYLFVAAAAAAADHFIAFFIHAISFSITFLSFNTRTQLFGHLC